MQDSCDYDLLVSWSLGTGDAQQALELETFLHDSAICVTLRPALGVTASQAVCRRSLFGGNLQFQIPLWAALGGSSVALTERLTGGVRLLLCFISAEGERRGVSDLIN